MIITRFGEILSMAEGLDEEHLKKAIRKSRAVFNRGGAGEEPPVSGEMMMVLMMRHEWMQCRRPKK
jgi:hypothetical protein